MAPSTHEWIDVHGHFYPPTSQAERLDRWKATRAAGFLVQDPSSFDWKPEQVIRYLDKAGIAMQMLSNIPSTLDKLTESNSYGASVVRKYPSRFGLLAALPTNNPQASLGEIDRAIAALEADGFAVCCHYNGVYLFDKQLEPVWEKLNAVRAVVFMHPDAYKPGHMGIPTPLVEAPIETTRTVVGMLYQGVFRRYPDIRFIVAHGGGAVPVLADRLELLGTEPWVPNPENIRKGEVKETLSRLYVDTAAVGVSSLLPALRLVGKDHVVYGADCGVPCSTEATMDENKASILAFEGLGEDERSQVGRNLHDLLPTAVCRLRGQS